MCCYIILILVRFDELPFENRICNKNYDEMDTAFTMMILNSDSRSPYTYTWKRTVSAGDQLKPTYHLRNSPPRVVSARRN